MENEGWIKLHRQFLKWEWHDSPGTAYLFVVLLLLANHEDERWHGMTVVRGQVITSLNSLSDLSGLSLRQVRTSLSRLENTGEICIKTTSKFTSVTVSNYDKYQVREEVVRQTNDMQTTNKRQTNDNQTTTNKNDKNVRMEEDNIIPKGMCPTVQSDVDPEAENDNEILTNRHCQNIVDFWNKTIDETQAILPKVATVTEARKKKMRIRWKEFSKVGDPVEVCRAVFLKMCASKFCQGDNKKGWSASFDWIFGNGTNWTKVYEGNYDDKPEGQYATASRSVANGSGRVANTINTFQEVEQWIHGRFSDTTTDSAPDSQFQQ